MSRLLASLTCAWRGHDTIRERRTHQGVPGVAGFRCQHCGDWTPMLDRTSSEHARVARQGAVRRPKTRREVVHV
jgi:hypothetical protein